MAICFSDLVGRPAMPPGIRASSVSCPSLGAPQRGWHDACLTEVALGVFGPFFARSPRMTNDVRTWHACFVAFHFEYLMTGPDNFFSSGLILHTSHVTSRVPPPSRHRLPTTSVGSQEPVREGMTGCLRRRSFTSESCSLLQRFVQRPKSPSLGTPLTAGNQA